MPPVIDRLCASPSALRLLRCGANAAYVPTACAATTATAGCTAAATTCRQYATYGTGLPKKKRRKLLERAKKIADRDQIRRLLEKEPRAVEAEPLGYPQGTGDDAAWAKVLAQVQRLKGAKGVKALWNTCRQRGYRLPTENTPDADYLWSTFSRYPDLVGPVIDHAAELLKQTNVAYSRLHYVVMGYWLPRKPKEALEYHHRMLLALNLQQLPLRDLARSVQSAFTPDAYKALLEIYRSSNERDLYDTVVPALIQKGSMTMARQWHSVCTLRGDLPSEAVACHPVVQILMATASAMADPKPHACTTKGTKQPQLDHGRYNQKLIRRLRGRDAAPVRFEDAFCARIFATRTFQPEAIIQGLTMVGVNEIGPQAVLAMATRTQPLEELPDRFAQLKAAGIALQGCVFSLALEKFSKEHKWHLVRSILDSDQHPDAFGDANVQRQLLEYYLDQKDYVQAQRTLAILTLFHNDSSAESWNLLFQLYLERSALHQVMELLQDMRMYGIMLTLESVTAVKNLLRVRQRGRRPVAGVGSHFDDVRFVTRVYLFILESGMGLISPLTWREIIRRFGMLGRFRELRRLLFRLLCWYAPRNRTQFASLPKSPFLDTALAKLRAAHPERNHYFHFPATVTQQENANHPIRQLFPPPLQQALIAWGFRVGILPNAHWEQCMLNPPLRKHKYRESLIHGKVLRRLDWSVGLRTVVQLRDMGVHIHYHTVLKALQAQFLNLFGPGQSNKVENRIMERINQKPYREYVREVNALWGKPLLVEPEMMGTRLGLQWHPRARRMTKRPAFIRLERIQDASRHSERGVEAGASMNKESAGDPCNPLPTHSE